MEIFQQIIGGKLYPRTFMKNISYRRTDLKCFFVVVEWKIWFRKEKITFCANWNVYNKLLDFVRKNVGILRIEKCACCYFDSFGNFGKEKFIILVAEKFVLWFWT